MTTTERSYATPPQLADSLKKYQQIAAFVGLVGLAALVSGYFLVGPEQFLRSYLVGMFFWFGMGMGCLVMLMIHFVSGGAWGVMIRRPLEAGTRTLYVMWLCFLPLLVFAPKLYFWADPAHASDKIVQLKHLYLNVPFLWIRWLIYGVVWLGLTTLLNKWSRLEDETKSWKYSSALCGRLSDVAGRDVVFHHIRLSGGGGAGFIRDVAGGRGADSSREVYTDGSCDHAETPARSGQTDAGAGDDVGLLVVLAVPDYLFGQPAAGDLLVRKAIERRMAVGGADAVVISFRFAVHIAAVANVEEESKDDIGNRYFHHLYSDRRRVLAGGAKFRRREPSGFYGFVA
jgi:hypothetical protein